MQNQEQSKQLEQLQNKRQKCIVYTRVMGYHRPVESFNIGKIGEHKTQATRVPWEPLESNKWQDKQTIARTTVP
jgi:hypothetical protein